MKNVDQVKLCQENIVLTVIVVQGWDHGFWFPSLYLSLFFKLFVVIYITLKWKKKRSSSLNIKAKHNVMSTQSREILIFSEEIVKSE